MSRSGNAEALFPSSDDEVQQAPAAVNKSNKRKHTSQAAPSTSAAPCTPVQTSSSRKKPHISPIAPKKLTVRDIFGSDSEDDDQQPPLGKSIPPLQSYISRRLANGHSRQTNENKQGTHFIELKVYSCDEIEKVQPLNRWRHAIVCVKSRSDPSTDAWQQFHCVTNFTASTRKEFRKCPVNFIGN